MQQLQLVLLYGVFFPGPVQTLGLDDFSGRSIFEDHKINLLIVHENGKYTSCMMQEEGSEGG